MNNRERYASGGIGKNGELVWSNDQIEPPCNLAVENGENIRIGRSESEADE